MPAESAPVPAPQFAAAAEPEPRKPLSPAERPGPPRESTAGAPSLFSLGPWKVRVAKHTWGERKSILQFVQDRTPQPLKEFRRRLDLLDGHPAAQGKLVEEFLDSAYIADKEWPPTFLSQPFVAAIFHDENLPDVLRLALARLNPEAIDAVAAYAESLPRMEEEAAISFINQYEHVIERWLVGSRPETRESIRGAIDPKGGGGEAPPETTPPPESESTATLPPSWGGSPPRSTN